LPIIALVLIGIVTARLSLDPQTTKLADLPEEQKTEAGQIDLVDAKYEGTDKRGRAYTLAAERATRTVAEPDVAILSHPKADIMLGDDQWLAVHAKKGAFDTKNKTLKLTDDVTFFHDSGYEMHLAQMTVDLKSETVQTQSAVQIQGPAAKLNAHGLEIKNQGDIIIFKGPATLTIRTDQVKGG
jgi:lipopolysaccharide export system protein LptC